MLLWGDAAENAAEYALDGIDWVMSRTESFARLGSNFAALANAALSSRTLRWLLEKAFGVSRRRRLPRFAMRNFLRRGGRRGWAPKPVFGRARGAAFCGDFSA